MNEDLQKELLSILRELKSGAGPAWQVLVEQRGGYYMMLAVGLFTMCIIGAVLAWRLALMAKSAADANRKLTIEEWHKRSYPDGFLFMASVSAVASGGTLVAAFYMLAAGLYPLGQLFGKVIG